MRVSMSPHTATRSGPGTLLAGFAATGLRTGIYRDQPHPSSALSGSRPGESDTARRRRIETAVQRSPRAPLRLGREVAAAKR
jgi:hypothetical protein